MEQQRKRKETLPCVNFVSHTERISNLQSIYRDLATHLTPKDIDPTND